MCRGFREVTGQERVNEVKGALMQEAGGTGGTEEDAKGALMQEAGGTGGTEEDAKVSQRRGCRR